MIKSIRLQNFQSHKETFLEFHEGVNVIVGPSDSGKTAILRALNWILQNRPSGEAFRSHWGGSTKAEVDFFDPDLEEVSRVTRFKDKTKNEYWFETGGDAYELKAVGREVPEEISSALNMDSINVQNQHDSPFLLSESPAEVARTLNRVTSLEDIDRSHQGINSMERQAHSALQGAEASLREYEEEIETFGYLEEMEVMVGGLEKREEKMLLLKSKQKKLETIIKDIEDCFQKIKRLSKTAKLRQRLDRLLERQENLESREASIRTFEDKINRFSLDLSRKRALTEELNKMKCSFRDMMPDICPLCGKEA